ncbi:MAG: SBBP repeat-containing protein, partial [Acidobacteria bacterium]|nr:SBBP repeat-containing protein [Acidobacteriota bacterium]
NQGQLEYDFVVHSGADPDKMQVAFVGAEKGEVDTAGDLVVHIAGKEIRQHRPRIYQEFDGERKVLHGGYRVRGKNRAAFEVAPHDKSRALVIDPVLSYCTYLGGRGSFAPDAPSNLGIANGIAVDSAGNAYVTGVTATPNFPIKGPVQGVNRGLQDVLVTKLNATGTAVIYSTYLGGSGNDGAYGIAVDNAGNAYITGVTGSSDFPTGSSPLQGVPGGGGGGDAFVAKLNSAGDTLIYSTFLGGSGDESGNGIAVDSSGNAYVVGFTTSTNFPTHNALFAAHQGGQDVFVAKLNSGGSAFVYSTYLGGSGDEVGTGIAIDSAGNAYVVGETASSNFPTTPGAFRTSHGRGSDAFVAKIALDGSALVYAGLLGGSGDASAYDIAVDGSGNAYVAGVTNSSDFPTTTGVFKKDFAGVDDAFVAKINASGNALVFSTYLGGSDSDIAWGIGVDSSGNVVVAGETRSTDFPVTADAFQAASGSAGLRVSVFLAKLDSEWSQLLYSTYLGGGSSQRAYRLALDRSGNAYLTGETRSYNLPTTPNAFQQALGLCPLIGGGCPTGLVAKFDFSADAQSGPWIPAGGVVNAASFLPGPVSAGEIITIFGSGIGPASLAGLQLDSQGRVGTSLANTKVLIDGEAVPLIYVWTNQVSAVVPYAPSFGGREPYPLLQIEYQGKRSNAVVLEIADSAPAIFSVNLTGKGQGAILNQDFSPNSPSNPAARGSVVMIYATGAGETNPQGVDGQIAGDPLPRPRLPVSALVGGRPAEVLYAGGAPGLVTAVLQVNVKIPNSVAPGDAVPVVLTIGNAASQTGITLAVR